MRPLPVALFLVGVVWLAGCRRSARDGGPTDGEGAATFSADLAFLSRHTGIEVLEDSSSGARVALAPAWQGRVMTSTAGGDDDGSYGWIHYDEVEAGIRPDHRREGLRRHIHLFGGEERLWLGPEGGQFGLFFPPEVPYDLEHWKVPAALDTEPFDVVGRSKSSIRFARSASLVNRAGTRFDLRIERAVQILSKASIAKLLEVPVPTTLATVGYRSTNELTNTGDRPWTRDGGLVSIWMLGMFRSGPDVTVVIPLADGPGEAVRTDYFGAPGDDRLRESDKAVFFRADGRFRSKIGIAPERSTGVAGSWDPALGLLTIVRCDRPANAADLAWVCSQWRDQEDPYDGEQVQAYNDGPAEPGADPLGPFYEIETSSPAMPLAPGASIVHVVDTIHFDCCPNTLGPIAEAVLGVTIDEIEGAFD